jgi:Zn finger protein HypA/HybF involved in hydrogenase expression
MEGVDWRNHMGKSVNWARCKDCEAKYGFENTDPFGIVLERLSKEEAKAEIEKAKCPKCNGTNWYFTDEMGQ